MQFMQCLVVNKMVTPVMRASTASRWMFCPEAAWLEQDFPDTENDAAREGTAAHEMAELVLTGTVGSPEELVDRAAKNSVIMTGDMVDHVQMYVDHVQERDVAFWVEESVEIQHPKLPQAKVTGRCDGAAFSFDDNSGMLYIDDLKYGHGIIEPFENWQELIYAAGIKYNKLSDQLIKGITIAIIQPRGYHHQGPIREWSITAEQLSKYEHQLLMGMAAVWSEFCNCNSGPHCRRCKRLAHCETAKAAGMNAIDVTNNALPDTDTPEQVAALLDMLKHASNTAKHLIDAVTARAEGMILNGQPIPGYSIEPGKGHSKFRDETAACGVATAMGVDLYERKTVTPAEAKRRGLSKDLVNSLSYTPSTAPRLVKRDVSTLANKVFKNEN